jgi:hypothetical protein
LVRLFKFSFFQKKIINNLLKLNHMKKQFTLFFSLLLTGAAIAQIPNAGFESWTAHTGYDTPDNWGNPNPYTSSFSTYTVEKGSGTPIPFGSYYLRLTTKTVGTPPVSAVVPGVAASGTITYTPPSTISVSGGFPSTIRPLSLTGSWQFMAFGSDQGRIAVLLSKWNSALNKRDTVSFTNYLLPGMVMSWAAFTIPLTYQSGKLPDTALIVASSSGTTPVVGSYLWLDNLAFAGNVPSGVVTITTDQANTTIFPNPAKTSATLYYYSLLSGEAKISFIDVSGRTVKVIKASVATGSNDIQLNLSGLMKGNYLISLSNGFGTEVKQLVIE